MSRSGAIIGNCPICDDFVWEGQRWTITTRDEMIHVECARKLRPGVKWTTVAPAQSQEGHLYLIRLKSGEIKLSKSTGIIFDTEGGLHPETEISHYARVDQPDLEE